VNHKNIKHMKELKLKVSVGNKQFEICRDIKGDKDLYSVFEVHYQGDHYEYLYRDNSSGAFSTPPKSRLTEEEVQFIGNYLERELAN